MVGAVATFSIMEINVPQSIICGDGGGGNGLAHSDAMLYCCDASLSIICRLIVSK